MRRLGILVGYVIGRVAAMMSSAAQPERHGPTARGAAESAVGVAALELFELGRRITLDLEVRLPHVGLNMQPRPRDIFAWRVDIPALGMFVFAGARPEDGLNDARLYLEGLVYPAPSRAAIVVGALEASMPGRLS